MRIEYGTIVKESGGRVLVEADGEEFCSHCSARGSCVSADHGGKRKIWIENSLKAAEGEQVAFGIEERGVVLASALLYLLPAAFLIAGAAAGMGFSAYFSADAETGAVVGALLGLVLFCPVLFAANRLMKHKKSLFAPVLISKTKDENKQQYAQRECAVPCLKD